MKNIQDLTFPNRLYYSYALFEWLFEITRDLGTSPQRIGILYDIGCTMQKGIENVSIIYHRKHLID